MIFIVYVAATIRGRWPFAVLTQRRRKPDSKFWSLKSIQLGGVNLVPDLWGSWQIRESNSRCSPAEPSGKVPDSHSVDSICDHDFGVFTVTNIATENTDAVLPAHPLPRTPKAANQGLQRCRGPSVPLTCLAPLAAWQSLCTGHLDASLENSVALAFSDGDHPSPAADTSVSLASERSPP